MFGRGHCENDVAANVCVPADDYTDPAPEKTLAHLDANTVCHVKFLSQKSTRRCRFLVAALPLFEIFTVTVCNHCLCFRWGFCPEIVTTFSHPRRLGGREKGCMFGRTPLRNETSCTFPASLWQNLQHRLVRFITTVLRGDELL